MKRVLKTLSRISVIGACLAMCAFAQYNLTLTGYNPNNYGIGGVYTNPYTMTVNGSEGLLMSCDDFLGDAYAGQTWTANRTHLQTDIDGVTANTTVKFDQSSASTQLRDYSAAAYLASALITWGTANGFDNETAGEYSFAIWGVFDAQLLDTGYQGSLPDGSTGKLRTDELTAAQGFLNQAYMFVDNPANTVADAYFFTDTQYATDPTARQEFIYVNGSNHVAKMAEPSSVGLLLLELTSVLGLVWAFRRRLAPVQ